ncbi:MAG: thymidylate synthase ThyX, partial [Endomicrobiia bacterium]
CSHRTGINREDLPQGAEVEHEILANAQAIINISRKRLCNQAAKETREAWKMLLETIKEQEPEIYKVCVPDCIYRGWCYEFKSCGYHKTPEFVERLKEYRAGINE